MHESKLPPTGSIRLFNNIATSAPNTGSAALDLQSNAPLLIYLSIHLDRLEYPTSSRLVSASLAVTKPLSAAAHVEVHSCSPTSVEG